MRFTAGIIAGIVSMLFLLLLPLPSIYVNATNSEEGFLFDPLEDYTNIYVHQNCSIKDGAITIDHVIENRTYTLLDENCTAYERKDAFFFLLFGPNMPTEEEFNHSQINNISYKDEGRAVTTTPIRSYLLPLHHFRFYTATPPKSVSKITILWNGSFNSDMVKVFVWDYSALVGRWRNVKDLTKIGENTINISFPSNYISEEGYIDIVFLPIFSYVEDLTKITTDYISIRVEISHCSPTAFFITKPIEVSPIWRWESVRWNGTTPTGTRIRCQILDENGDVINSIEGNDYGFTDSPVDLSMLSGEEYKKIRLKFYLETDDQRYLPILFDYTLLWQREKERWMDSGFSVRVEKKTEDEIVSIPIHNPPGYWWKEFYADYHGNISFKILDANGKVLMEDVKPGNNISSLCTRTIRLYAKLEKNASMESWGVTFKESKEKPEFADFGPEGVNRPEISFTIKATDDYPGLLPSSAKYKVEYRKNDSNILFASSWISLKYSGENCTKELKIITPKIPVFYSPSLENLLDLKGEKNITLYSLRFYIEDMAGNAIESDGYKVYVDTTPPVSYLFNNLEFRHRNEIITLKAWADDDKTGVKEVFLYFSYSLDNLTFTEPEVYGIDESPPWEWEFIPEKSGYYRFFSVATDGAGNKEDLKSDGLILLFDINPPSKPVFNNEIKWLTSKNIDSVVFEDDFMLDSIEYKLGGEERWYKVVDNINATKFEGSWNISNIDWESMEEGKEYFVYFRVTDSLGNQYVTQDAMIIVKDTKPPVAYIDKIKGWQWRAPFQITTYTLDKESGIYNISLYYQYSKDNKTWSEWELYESTNKSGEQDWSFSAPRGDGYYRFYVKAVDQAGNVKASNYIIVGVTTLPTTYILIFIILFVILMVAIFAIIKL